MEIKKGENLKYIEIPVTNQDKISLGLINDIKYKGEDERIIFSHYKTNDYYNFEYQVCTFDDLEVLCSEPNVAKIKEGPAFSPCSFSDKRRDIFEWLECDFLVFNIHNTPCKITAEKILSCIDGVRSFCHSTYNHKEYLYGSRYRVVIKINKPIWANDYQYLAKKYSIMFSSLGAVVDSECFGAEKYYYYPRCPENGCNDFEFASQPGRALNWRKIMNTRNIEVKYVKNLLEYIDM